MLMVFINKPSENTYPRVVGVTIDRARNRDSTRGGTSKTSNQLMDVKSFHHDVLTVSVSRIDNNFHH